MVNLIVYDDRLRELMKDTKVIRVSEYRKDHFLVVSKLNLRGKLDM